MVSTRRRRTWSVCTHLELGSKEAKTPGLPRKNEGQMGGNRKKVRE